MIIESSYSFLIVPIKIEQFKLKLRLEFGLKKILFVLMFIECNSLKLRKETFMVFKTAEIHVGASCFKNSLGEQRNFPGKRVKE